MKIRIPKRDATSSVKSDNNSSKSNQSRNRQSERKVDSDTLTKMLKIK